MFVFKTAGRGIFQEETLLFIREQNKSYPAAN